MNSIFLFIICVTLGSTGAWIIFIWGKDIGLLDKPKNRSSHKRIVPKGGGIGILMAFIFSSLILKMPIGFWLSATILALFSFWGDKVELSPKIRLAVQFIAALSFLVTSSSSFLFPLISPISSILWFIFAVVFVMGTANYYNFMDGINGIAGITGLVGFGLLALFASYENSDPKVIILCICIELACIGFLPFNIPKAKVFMGDVGSILLGFIFAGMVVWLSKNLVDLICLACFLFPFYADELTTLIVRIKDRDRLTRPHRRHLYQLLANEMGISHWKVSVGYGILQFVVGGSVLIVRPFLGIMVLLMMAVWFAGFVVLSFGIRKRINQRQSPAFPC